MGEHEVLVVGIGNRLRADDGVGPLVVDVLVSWRNAGDPALADVALVESDGEPARLVETWAGAALAVVVDASVSGAPAGCVHTVVVTEHGPVPVPQRHTPASSHAAGVSEAVSLGRVLGRLPTRLVVVAVEAGDLSFGAPPTPPVLAVVADAADAVRAELCAARSS